MSIIGTVHFANDLVLAELLNPAKKYGMSHVVVAEKNILW